MLLGVDTVPVFVGPVSYLFLSKPTKGVDKTFDLLSFLDKIHPLYKYVVPDYPMTGHLLVKNDAYSYGVVLLELLSGRKSIDMLMPSGQENLAAWALPFLAEQ